MPSACPQIDPIDTGTGGIGDLEPTMPRVGLPPSLMGVAPVGRIPNPPPPTRPPTPPPTSPPGFTRVTQMPLIGDITLGPPGPPSAPDCSVGHRDCRRCLETSGCRYCDVPVEGVYEH